MKSFFVLGALALGTASATTYPNCAHDNCYNQFISDSAGDLKENSGAFCMQWLAGQNDDCEGLPSSYANCGTGRNGVRAVSSACSCVVYTATHTPTTTPCDDTTTSTPAAQTTTTTPCDDTTTTTPAAQSTTTTPCDDTTTTTPAAQTTTTTPCDDTTTTTPAAQTTTTTPCDDTTTTTPAAQTTTTTPCDDDTTTTTPAGQTTTTTPYDHHNSL
ncbi:hypothetical protein G7046_g7916 [Stylonectria norvegica]|nr:hypothetical protein G7046_g7916 [Stylonectria norvegica]